MKEISKEEQSDNSYRHESRTEKPVGGSEQHSEQQHSEQQHSEQQHSEQEHSEQEHSEQELSEQELSEQQELSEPQELSAFKYDRSARYINMLMTNIKDGCFMNKYLHMLPHSERWITMLRMYRHVMKAMCHLKTARLIHWDLHIENIMVDPNKSIPYMIDFGLSINPVDINERHFISSHFPMFPHFYRWPVETQFILWSHSLEDKGPLTPDDILQHEAMVPELIESFTSHMKFLDICSTSFRNRYIMSIQSFYSGFRIEHAHSDLMWLGWQTWDSYSIAVLFLGFICSMYSPGFPVNNRMLRDFFQLLLEGVHYDWRRRPTVESLLERIDVILNRTYDPEEVLMSREYPTFENEGGCPE